jgi:putative RecB family exonuclease
MSTIILQPASIRAPPAPKHRDYLSYSAISTYAKCPLRYFFKYVAGLPDELVSASLVFGGAIHRAIEHHFRELLAGNPPVTLSDLMAAYQTEWTEREASKIHFGKDSKLSLDTLAARMLDAFRQHDLAKPHGRVLAVEEELRGAIIPGLPDILARIDLIVETPDELIVSDWKTSRTKWTQENVDESADQLILYSELARDFAPDKAVRIEFAVLTKTKDINIERHRLGVSRGQVDRTKRIVSRIFRAIQGENFYPAPSQMNCPGCPFREPCRKWPG